MGKLGCRNQCKIVFCLEYEGKNKSYSTVQVYTSVYYYVCGIMNYVLLFIMNYVLLFNNVHYYIIQYIIYIVRFYMFLQYASVFFRHAQDAVLALP